LLVTVNNRLKFVIKIVHDLSCHPICAVFLPALASDHYFITRPFTQESLQTNAACIHSCYSTGYIKRKKVVQKAAKNSEFKRQLELRDSMDGR